MERKGHGKALEHLIPEILALGETEFSRDRQSPSWPKETISFEVLAGPKVLIFASLTNASISSVEALQEWQVMLFSLQKCLDSKIGYTEI